MMEKHEQKSKVPKYLPNRVSKVCSAPSKAAMIQVRIPAYTPATISSSIIPRPPGARSAGPHGHGLVISRKRNSTNATR